MSEELDDMRDSILAVYDSATGDQKVAGRAWYGVAGNVVTAIADQTGIVEERIAYALAALSPRNPWRWNVADTYCFAVAAGSGGDMPSATTFKRNQRAAWRALADGGQPWLSAALKVRAFVRAVTGDADAVVVDVWAYRVAKGVSPDRAVKAGEYGPIADAYRQAAALRGESPSSMQAITWLVAQTEGLATRRTGRHDLAFKAGTPEFVKGLFS